MSVFKISLSALLGALTLASAGCSQGSVGETTSRLAASSADRPFGAPKHLIYSTNSWPSPLSIVTHDLAASGDALPLATIAGSNTGFQFDVGGLGVDSQGYLYAATSNVGAPGAILVFAPGSNGDVSPVRTITAASYGGIYSANIAIDASDNLWVADYKVPAIYEFASGANGDVRPIRTIAGSATQLVNPFGLAIDKHGALWVVDVRAAKIMKFEAGAHGNVAPKRVISGPATGITGPVGIALSGTGDVWVSNVSFIPPAKIYGFHSNDNGNVAPSQTIAASPDNYFVNGGPAYLNGRIVFPGVGQGSEVVLDTYAASISGPPTLLRAIYGPDTGLASGEFVAVH